jgi:hypothetical protein
MLPSATNFGQKPEILAEKKKPEVRQPPHIPKHDPLQAMNAMRFNPIVQWKKLNVVNIHAPYRPIYNKNHHRRFE